ncbi:MAG: nicotinate-nucleotide--dimethylbenzimidazole phosphoribosyltransferase [Hyphomicrobiaceae bacterium]|nr:nicotinate-nucleotide--dimethylbenzimidazole phosphoribosyltransferase [Hyphomicrobiaceae bacterium]
MTNVETTHAWWADAASSLRSLTASDGVAYDAARARQDNLTKPPGALGRLEDLACWLAGWQGREAPRLDTVEALVFAGNHGVTARGVSPYPVTVTAQMVENFQSGGAAICQLCDAYGVRLRVTALDLDNPTADMCDEPAMTPDECVAAIERGAEAVNPNSDLLLLGEMGIGNTTVAAALCCALLGGDAADWTGPGTGLDAQGVARKAETVGCALSRHLPYCDDPFEGLRRLGGRELAAIAGAIMAARTRRIPVILDGYVCTAAALVLEKAQDGAIDHCLAGHLSVEPGHARLLRALNLNPIVELGMRLGEGTGAAVAYAVLRGAVATHNGMATFAGAGVDNKA